MTIITCGALIDSGTSEFPLNSFTLDFAFPRKFEIRDPLLLLESPFVVVVVVAFCC